MLDETLTTLTGTARNVSCPVCAAPARFVGVKQTFSWHRCRRCRHLFVSNLPGDGELARIYRRYSYDSGGALEVVPAFIAGQLKALAYSFEPYSGSRRMLDVGFGAGALLRAFADAGWDVFGIETSELAVRAAHEHGFSNTICGDFLTAAYSTGTFDLIVMTELLEHVKNPDAFVAQALRLLRTDGVLYLTTPNGFGANARVLGLDWTVVAPPEHLSLFSRRSLSLALSKAGFRVLSVRTTGLNPIELIGRLRSDRASHQAKAPPDRVGTSYALNERMTRNRSGQILKGLANYVLTATGTGDSLKAVAQKVSDERVRVK